jgi:hypothetical protein
MARSNRPGRLTLVMRNGHRRCGFVNEMQTPEIDEIAEPTMPLISGTPVSITVTVADDTL